MLFEGHDEPTVGCEWELQLLRADDLELADGILALMGHLGENALIRPEYLQCCVEISTPPCHDAEGIERELVRVLRHTATEARALDLQLAGAGTHPFDKKLGIVTPSPRYLSMATMHAMMPVTPVTFATHVHVACRDGDSAIRAMSRLTPCIPALLALGANSPFWHGLDTQYACYRQRSLASNPTFGLPPYFEAWADYDRMLRAAERSRTISSFRDLHWDIRPHGDIGTLEFRVFDAQIDARRVAQLAALVRALVVTAAAETASPFPPRLPHWMELENQFRASRAGLEADLIVSAAGDRKPAGEVLEQLFAIARPTAEQLGDGELFSSLERTVFTDNGAARQRREYEPRHSVQDVTAFLVEAMDPTA